MGKTWYERLGETKVTCKVIRPMCSNYSTRDALLAF